MSDAAPTSPGTTILPRAPTLARSPRRAAVLLTLILLLHLLLVDWLGDGTRRRSAPMPDTQNLVTLTLGIDPPKAIVDSGITPPVAVTPVAPRAARIARLKSVAPARQPEPTPVAQSEQLPDVVDKSMTETEPAPPITASEPAVTITPLSTGEQIGEVAATQTNAQAGAGQVGQAVPLAEHVPELAARALEEPSKMAHDGMLYDPPPSAEVKYDVEALRDGKTVYGSGKISWHSQGDRYVIDGEAGVLFFSVLTFHSEGGLDHEGITPVKYSEKRFRKSETNTHFRRDPQIISFSASTAQYPRNGGEQDRASIIWQLAAIGRGNPTQFQAGKNLQIFVAGVRDGEVWTIAVLGQESIEVGRSKLDVWHLQRLPRAGSFDTQVDIWLAPSRDWYPVKLRQTERNGDFLDMAMSKITPL